MSTKTSKDFDPFAFVCANTRVASSSCAVGGKHNLFYQSPFWRDSQHFLVTFSLASSLKHQSNKVLTIFTGRCVHLWFIPGWRWLGSPWL